MTRSDVIGLVDRVNGAVLRALAAADALVSVDREAEQVLADARRALLVNNVRNILVAEETEGRKNGVRSSLSETAERVGLDVSAKLIQLVDVLHRALTAGDPVKDLKKSLHTDTAGSALSAGLVNRELKEELRNIDHTGVLVHDDKTA